MQGYKIARENELNFIVENPLGEFDIVPRSMFTTLEDYVNGLPEIPTHKSPTNRLNAMAKLLLAAVVYSWDKSCGDNAEFYLKNEGTNDARLMYEADNSFMKACVEGNAMRAWKMASNVNQKAIAHVLFGRDVRTTTKGIAGYDSGGATELIIVVFWHDIEPNDIAMEYINRRAQDEVDARTHPAHVSSPYDCTGQAFGSDVSQIHSETSQLQSTFLFRHTYSIDI